LVMGVLRWRSVLDEQIANVSERPLRKIDLETLTAIRLGVYQVGRLARIPSHAAVDESVELVKRARKGSAAAFVNAVLRKLVAARGDRGASGFGEAGELAVSAHPPWLVERWIRAYGLETAHRICEYDQSVPVMALGLCDSGSQSASEIERRLLNEGIELAPGALMASARRVLRGDVTSSAVFKEGLCFIQDEGSQLVAALVGQGKRILDCCAAPGGKTRVIADRNRDAQIVAVDLHEHRARLLRRLLSRGSSERRSAHGILTVAADVRNLPFTRQFDRILADVPCSGTGTLARNPEIKWRLRPEDVRDLQSRQMAILRSAMNQVASGGRLVCSTCSLEREENEEVVERVMQEDASFRLLDCCAELEKLKSKGRVIWPDVSSLTHGPYLRTIPGVHPFDGFFAAVLENA
jgi:16S rRNA (cytosine967-C5)-methyltransferase